MKKITFFCSFLTGFMLLTTGKTNAQVASTKGWFEGVSKELTTSGKPYLYSSESDDDDNSIITIYDEDMQVTKKIEIASFRYESKSWYEYAKVMPTGVKIVNSNVTESNEMSGIGIDLTKATSVEELNSLLESSGNGWYYYAYLDADGNICVGSSSYFFGVEFFRYKYNREYFTILDGKEVRVSARYEYTYPEDNILWEADMDNASIYSSTRELISDDVSFYDMDSSVPAEQYTCITQSLFNDDDKWEYVAPVYEMTTEYSTPEVEREDNVEGLTLRRYVSQDAEVRKYNIVSDDGSVIAQILPPNNNMKSWNDEDQLLYRMNGKIYLSVEWVELKDNGGSYDVLYQIDTKTNSVKTMRSVKGEGRFATVSDNAIQIRLDDNEKGQDVMLSDTAGKVIGKNHVPAGEHSAQMNASQLRHGIYNITLLRNGKVHKSQKIRIR